MIAKTIVENRALKGITNSHPLDIRYKKKEGEIVQRRIEPYEIKTEKVLDEYGYMKAVTFLYGYDISMSVPYKHRHIKRWIIDRFITLRLIDNVIFKKRAF